MLRLKIIFIGARVSKLGCVTIIDLVQQCNADLMLIVLKMEHWKMCNCCCYFFLCFCCCCCCFITTVLLVTFIQPGILATLFTTFKINLYPDLTVRDQHPQKSRILIVRTVQFTDELPFTRTSNFAALPSTISMSWILWMNSGLTAPAGTGSRLNTSF